MSVSIYPVPLSGIQETIVDAKGDIIAATAADVTSRLAVGANDTVLTADSSTATGLKWATPTSTSGPAFFVRRTSTVQSLTNNTQTKIQFNTEVFDTDNCYDNSTNYRFTPNKAGYYQINSVVQMSSGSFSFGEIYIYKNGSNYATGNLVPKNVDAYVGIVATAVVYLNGTTDYVEIYGYAGGSSGTTSVNPGEQVSFSGVWIRS